MAKSSNAARATADANPFAAGVDYVQFCHTVLKDIEHGGRPITLAAIHLSWIAHIAYCWARDRDALILAPMGHGKSSDIAVGLPAYLLGVNPNNRIKILSANDDLAKDRVGLVRTYIEDDADYRRVFPHVQPARKDAWTKSKLYVARTGRGTDASLEAKGILSTGVGGRCDYLFLDDPSDQKNSYSPTIRRSVRERYNLTWRTRVEPWGKVVCIATPYHEEDLVHWIAGRETTCTLRQWISDDYGHIAFEVTHAPDDAHPLLPYRGA